MTDQQAINEKKVFDAIQELKDSIFGMNQPYIGYCYDYSLENGHSLNIDRVDEFANALSETSKKVSVYDNHFSEVLPSFFRLSVLFLDAVCNPSDWIFVSIRKIAETVYKQDNDQQSTFDIMVEKSSIHRFAAKETFYKEYNHFNKCIHDVEMTNFARCVKLTLECFIDEKELNPLADDDSIRAIISRVNRTSSVISREIQRRSTLRG